MPWDSNSGRFPVFDPLFPLASTISMSMIHDAYKVASYTIPDANYSISNFGGPGKYLWDNPTTSNLVPTAAVGTSLSLSYFYGKYYLDPSPLVEYYPYQPNRDIISTPTTVKRPTPTKFRIEAFGAGGGGGSGGGAYTYTAVSGGFQNGGGGGGGSSGEYVVSPEQIIPAGDIYRISFDSWGVKGAGYPNGGYDSATTPGAGSAGSPGTGDMNIKWDKRSNPGLYNRVIAKPGAGGARGNGGYYDSGAVRSRPGGGGAGGTITLGGGYYQNGTFQYGASYIPGTSGITGGAGGGGGLEGGINNNNNANHGEFGHGGLGGYGSPGGGGGAGLDGKNSGFIITWSFT